MTFHCTIIWQAKHVLFYTDSIITADCLDGKYKSLLVFLRWNVEGRQGLFSLRVFLVALCTSPLLHFIVNVCSNMFSAILHDWPFPWLDEGHILSVGVFIFPHSSSSLSCFASPSLCSKFTVYSNTTGCSEPLGMKSRLISDAQISASSAFRTWGIDSFTWHPQFARLDKHGKTNAWSPARNNRSEWIQVCSKTAAKILLVLKRILF